LDLSGVGSGGSLLGLAVLSGGTPIPRIRQSLNLRNDNASHDEITTEGWLVEDVAEIA